MVHLVQDRKNNILYLTLNRPEVHNAFNDDLIGEITSAFQSTYEDSDLRAVVLQGEGKSFCAGADLNWMKSMKDYSFDENYADSMRLSDMFVAIEQCPVPVVCRLHGAALGGGVGLVSSCDYVLALDSAKLGLTEVNLGLIPAVISPFVINKIGISHARALFLSGEIFKADHGQVIGLVHKVYSSLEDLDTGLEKLLTKISKTGPLASRKAKDLVFDNMKYADNFEFLRAHTAKLIAGQRISEEGQEGMSALLEKRDANWQKI